MNANLRQRLAKIEATQTPPTLWGDFLHEDGRPTQHDFWGKRLDLERWFATGELPKDVGVFVLCWTEGQMRRYDGWQPFPELHPDAIKMLEKIITFTTTVHGVMYYFDGRVFRGVGGVLPPHEQVRELRPHG